MKLIFTFLILLSQSLPLWSQSILYRTREDGYKEIETHLGDNFIRFEYYPIESSQKKVWGEEIPYDQVWAGAAGKPSIISFSKDINLYGYRLRAGRYALLFVPRRALNRWKIIFCRNLERFDDPKDYALYVLSRAPIKAENRTDLLYLFDLLPTRKAQLKMKWGKRQIYFEFSNAQ